MAKADSRTVLYNILRDMWRLTEHHGAEKLDDRGWKNFVKDGENMLEKYRTCDNDLEILYRDMFGALQSFYRRKGKRDGGKKE